MAETRGDVFTTLMLGALTNTDRIVDLQTLAMGILGIKDDKGNPIMSEMELNNPFQFLVLNQLAALFRSQLQDVHDIFAKRANY